MLFCNSNVDTYKRLFFSCDMILNFYKVYEFFLFTDGMLFYCLDRYYVKNYDESTLHHIAKVLLYKKYFLYLSKRKADSPMLVNL